MNTTTDIQENTRLNYNDNEVSTRWNEITPFVALSNVYTHLNTTSNSSIVDDDLERLLEKSRLYHQQLQQLKEDIGANLYNQLTPEKRDWIIKTEGSIDLGKEYTEEDFKKLFKFLREYED